MKPTLATADPLDADDAARAEFRLFVWISPSRGWRARVVGADAFERDFASPFELARFVVRPITAAGPRGPGLR